MEESLDPVTEEEWEGLQRLGSRMLDDMMNYLRTVRERPAWQPVPGEVAGRLTGPLPLDPVPLEAVYDQFTRDVLPYPTGNIHPRFWGWVMGTGTPVGMLAELLTAAMNAHVGGYDQAATHVERQVVRWLIELLGYPPAASGLLVSGATAANLIGLTVARNAKAGFDVRASGLGALERPRLLIYASTETHSWLTKSCELLGLGRAAIRLVPVDAEFRIELGTLREMVDRDRRDGQRPICVIGNAGTVNTGATDDLRSLAAFCRQEDLWFHVDGAFGALAALAPALQPIVAGMQEADSLAFDLHKWGYVQYEAGCILVRDAAVHRATFALTPDYLRPTAGGISIDPTHFADLGTQLSRSFRALKVWMTLQAQGARAWGRVIQQNVDQASYLAGLIEASDELELLAPVPLNVVCFRYAGDLDEERRRVVNEAILVELQVRGIAVPSGTTITGPAGPRFGLRVANTNHRSRREDFRMLVEAVLELGHELSSPVASPVAH
ncbi:MAG TPA: pyridoxal-dependent decarboxylase [Gemmatimonadales bacterium]|nr:pyridoxal-dependent decarboxylase [Gemmatimonadales bacterium]